MKSILLIFLLCLLTGSARAAFVTEPVEYSDGETVMSGYLAYDDAVKGKRPGILVVHEWWGHNDYARKRAEMLAGLGYTALAVDMYGEGKVAAHPEEAGEFASAVKQQFATSGKNRFLAAMDILQNHPTVDAARIGAIGYCFGGSTVLQMARYGLDLKGVVSFHGSLGTDAPAHPGAVKAKVLVAHGADDSFISPEEIQAFKQEMETAGVDYRFIGYPGAVHSFTNPDADKIAAEFGLPIAYNAAADEQSWKDMQEFFQEIFKL